MMKLLSARPLATASLSLLLVACAKGPYPALKPFEALTAPPPAPPGLVEGLQADGAALQAAAVAQQSLP